jgi:hypothetical protein
MHVDSSFSYLRFAEAVSFDIKKLRRSCTGHFKFFTNLQRYLQVKVHQHINDTGGQFATGINETGISNTGGEFATNTTSVVDIAGKFAIVSTTLAANLPSV